MYRKNVKIFLWWMEERHSIFLKKQAGEPWPWTKCKILQEYKFTNPYRQNDKVTRELGMRLNTSDSKETLFKKIIIFRMFNWPSTYDVLNDADLILKWNAHRAIKLLREYKEQGNKIFTCAYMMTGVGAKGKGGKIDLACNSINEMLMDSKGTLQCILNHNTLEEATRALSQYSMVGNFVAYEFVCDMRHTKILNGATDIYHWANPGPGAKRGIHRLLYNTVRGEVPEDRKTHTPKGYEDDKPYRVKVDYQKYMQDLMYLAQTKLGKEVEMRDIEHSLCEFDKYMRVKNNEGTPRSKYKCTQ